MNNDRPVENLTDGEPVSEKYLKRIAPVFKQRRQIAGMVWMGEIIRIIMSQNVREEVCFRPAALRTAVDMEAKDSMAACCGLSGESGYGDCGKNTPFCLVKPDISGQMRVFFTSGEPCVCVRSAGKHCDQISEGWVFSHIGSSQSDLIIHTMKIFSKRFLD